MKSKTIIISGQNSAGRGILTLYLEDDLLKAKLRLYDFPALNAYCKLGVYHNNEVYSSNLIFKNGFYSTSLVGNFDLSADFYTAIIDTNADNSVLLSGGTYAGFYFDDNSVFTPNSISNSTPSNSFEPTKSDKPILVKEAEPQKVHEAISTPCEKDCANCKYKEYFYANNTLQTEIQDNDKSEEVKPISQPNKEKVAPTILDSLIPQFDYIIKNYPENSELNNILTGAKFVSIEEGESNYSIGAIYEADKMKYICYAIRCNYNTPAPEELGKFYQWLPIDSEDPLSEGYYIVYQDAVDLKIIEI